MEGETKPERNVRATLLITKGSNLARKGNVEGIERRSRRWCSVAFHVGARAHEVGASRPAEGVPEQRTAQIPEVHRTAQGWEELGELIHITG